MAKEACGVSAAGENLPVSGQAQNNRAERSNSAAQSACRQAAGAGLAAAVAAAILAAATATSDE
ncbi:MAG: hypothetical protein IJ783_07505 [Kiritimatiellae bacterium]|nr:hypothetical protein [Kiritimatiellia bacterium]